MTMLMTENLWKIVSYASLALAGGVLVWILLKTKRAGLTLTDWPNTRFRYDEVILGEAFQKGGKALHGYLWLSLLLEVLLCPALAAVAHNTAGIRPIRLAMYTLALVRTVLGFLETLCLMRLQKKSRPGLTRFSSLLAFGKWSAFSLWVLGMFICLLVSGAKM